MSQPTDPFSSQYKNLSQKRLLKVLIGASGAISIKKMSRTERLFRKALRLASSHFSIWSVAWAEFALTRGYSWLKRGTGIVAFLLFTGVGLSVYAIAQYVFPFLPWHGWLLTLFATTILAQTFVIHYSGVAHERIEREKTEELEDRIWLLEDRLHPNLQIDYRPHEEAPFVQVGDCVTQYRVSVRSPVPITDVELVVNHLKTPQLPTLFDIHLRPMHDLDYKKGTKRVSLKAKREKHWDLVAVHDAPPHGRGTVVLTCIPSLGVIELAPGDYEFELMATGGDRPEATKIATLKVGDDYRVALLDIRDGRLSSLLA